MKMLRKYLLVLACAVVTVCGVGAQQGITTSVLPMGVWSLCETGAAYAGMLCAGFVPGNEGFMLLVRTEDLRVVAYRYTVTGTLISTGAEVTLSGVAQRVDSVGGIYQTSVPLFFGGIAKDFRIKVDGLGLTETR